MQRWAIWIDIEGFSKIYPKDSIRALGPMRSMMETIYAIGNGFCPEPPDRIFVHHIGDGFIIVSEFSERSPQVPIAIAAILMQTAAMAGGMTKCAISQGEFADIQGCYPDVIRRSDDGSGSVRLGGGLMTVFPVMGSALINAHRLAGRMSGSILMIDADLSVSLPQDIEVTRRKKGYMVLDWVHAQTREMCEIKTETRVNLPTPEEAESAVRSYVRDNKSTLPRRWRRNTLVFNKCLPWICGWTA